MHATVIRENTAFAINVTGFETQLCTSAVRSAGHASCG